MPLKDLGTFIIKKSSVPETSKDLSQPDAINLNVLHRLSMRLDGVPRRAQGLLEGY